MKNPKVGKQFHACTERESYHCQGKQHILQIRTNTCATCVLLPHVHHVFRRSCYLCSDTHTSSDIALSFKRPTTAYHDVDVVHAHSLCSTHNHPLCNQFRDIPIHVHVLIHLSPQTALTPLKLVPKATRCRPKCKLEQQH